MRIEREDICFNSENALVFKSKEEVSITDESIKEMGNQILDPSKVECGGSVEITGRARNNGEKEVEGKLTWTW